MKIAALTGIGQIGLSKAPVPKIKHPKDVLLKVKAVGICGSDIHYYKTGRIGNQTIKYPFVIGHECSAVVVEIGSNVTGVTCGDLVAVDPAISCGECDQCLQGRRHTCRNLKFLGNPGESEGCLAEYIILPESCCYTLPDKLNVFDGVIVEPISIANYSVKFLPKTRINSVGILGAGTIGLSVLLNMRKVNPSRIFMTDKLDYRLSKAQEFGADWIGNPDKLKVVEGIKKAEPGLLDVVFECCGQQAALDQSVRLLKPGGSLIIIGIPEIERISLDIHSIRRNEISIFNVRRQNDCVNSTINFISENTETKKLITHTFNSNEIPEAYKLVSEYSDEVIKAVIQFD